MKLDRTKYFIRGNEQYPELIRQFFKGCHNINFCNYKDSDSIYSHHFIAKNIVCKYPLNSYRLKGNPELKLTDLAIKNDLGEEYAPKMKEFFEKLGCQTTEIKFKKNIYYSISPNSEYQIITIIDEIWGHLNKVPILLSDWLGMEEPKEKTESLTAFEAEVLEKTKRRTFKIESFRDKRIKEQQHIFIPYQLCPKCNGQGIVFISTLHTSSCDVCNGQKIIPMYLKQ